MLEYRPIGPDDVAEVTRFALAALAPIAAREPVRISEAKVRGAVGYFAKTRESHFQRAAFDGFRCVAAIALYVADMPFFERSEGFVYFAFSERPGAGVRLIREMMAWVATEMCIRRVTWMLNDDERLSYPLDRRFGFHRHREALVFYKE